MEDIDKEVLSHIPPKTKTLIEKLFKTSVEDFYEKLLNLETDEPILSIPINIRRDQYLIIVTKEKEDCCVAKFCKGPSFINEVLKPSEEQQDMVAAFSERAESVRAGMVNPTEDNMLKIVRC